MAGQKWWICLNNKKKSERQQVTSHYCTFNSSSGDIKNINLIYSQIQYIQLYLKTLLITQIPGNKYRKKGLNSSQS